ncbi:MAG: hypothetical protein QXE61_01425 [Nitrososphaerota archaeon]
MNKTDNPIIKMLLWRVRKLKTEEVVQVLSIIASLQDRVFTLTDIVDELPKEISQNRQKRRCVGTLLKNLSEIGYLSKPSERKWVKNASSLSHFLNQFILELSSLEKTFYARPQQEKKKKVLGVLEKIDKTSR